MSRQSFFPFHEKHEVTALKYIGFTGVIRLEHENTQILVVYLPLSHQTVNPIDVLSISFWLCATNRSSQLRSALDLQDTVLISA